MLQLRSECHTVWCWVQLPGHSSIPVDAAEGTMQHSTLGTDTNGWTQMTSHCHPMSMRCAPSAQSVRQLLTAVDSLKSQLHPRSTYWPHHRLWWAGWDRSKLLSNWMLVRPILNAEKKVWESKEVYFTHCRVIVRTKQRQLSFQAREAKWRVTLKNHRHPVSIFHNQHSQPSPRAQPPHSRFSSTRRWCWLVCCCVPLGEKKPGHNCGKGGGGAGRGKGPHLAVFASAKQKSHLHSWRMHEETSLLTLSLTHMQQNSLCHYINTTNTMYKKTISFPFQVV